MPHTPVFTAMALACAMTSAHAQSPVTQRTPSLQLSYGLLGEPLVRATSREAANAADLCRQPSRANLHQLTLLGAIEQVLCQSPQLQQALLLVSEQQASVTVAQTAFRPRVAANAELATNRIPSSNSGSGSLSSSLTGAIGVTWVLYDAGVRDANLLQARQVLSSGEAARAAALLNAVNEALRLYVEAAAASTRLEALSEAQDIARQSLAVAQARHEGMVASLAEKLQAQTALAQASLERVRAQGVWETTQGLLALALGYPVGTSITLAPVAQAFPTAVVTPSQARTGEWIRTVAQNHPRVRSAQADVQALQARLASVQAEGKPNVSLTVGAGSTRDLGTANSRFEHSLSGSLVASVPLFVSTAQQAREQQIQAQVNSREAVIEQVQRDVHAELWRNARQLDTETQNFDAATALLVVARQSHDITLGRYKSGVGSLLELLATQTALGNARAQLTQAQLAQAQARLRLEVATGQIALGKTIRP
jgi:outer membrane protein